MTSFRSYQGLRGGRKGRRWASPALLPRGTYVRACRQGGGYPQNTPSPPNLHTRRAISARVEPRWGRWGGGKKSFWFFLHAISPQVAFHVGGRCIKPTSALPSGGRRFRRATETSRARPLVFATASGSATDQASPLPHHPQQTLTASKPRSAGLPPSKPPLSPGSDP